METEFLEIDWKLTFHHVHKMVPRFITLLITNFCAEWDGVYDHLRYVSWEVIFKLSASAATSDFCGWVQVGIRFSHSEREGEACPPPICDFFLNPPIKTDAPMGCIHAYSKS